MPSAIPSASILPLFNTMMLFAVKPGQSYHSVQEVFTRHKPRLSIRYLSFPYSYHKLYTSIPSSGWYHGPAPLLDSAKSSLSQILSSSSSSDVASDDLDSALFYPLPPKSDGTADEEGEGEGEALSPEEAEYLSQFINPLYLKKNTMSDVNTQFCDNSSLQLSDFLRRDLAVAISSAFIKADLTQCAGGRRPQLDPTLGISSCWRVVGPPVKQRYLRFEPSPRPSSSSSSSEEEEEEATPIPFIHTQLSEAVEATVAAGTVGEAYSAQVGSQLQKLLKDLFCSAVFAKYLRIVTSLEPVGVRGEVRRFRPGLVSYNLYCPNPNPI